MDVCNAGDGNDGADAGFLDFYFVQTIIFIKLADLYFLHLIGFVMIDDDNVLIDLDSAVVYLADTDSSHVFVVVDRADQNLCTGIRITLRSGNVLDDGIKERCHILAFYGKLCGSSTGLG